MATQEDLLRLKFEAEGQKVVAEIRKDVTALGDAAGDAEKQASALLQEFADTAKLEKSAESLRKVGAAALDNQRKLTASTAAIKELVAQERVAAAAEKDHAAALAASRAALETLKNSAAEFTGKTKEFAEAQKAAKSEIARLNAEHRASAAALKEVSAAVEKERANASKASAARDKSLATVRALRKELDGAGVSTKSAAATEAELAARVAKTAAAMRDLAAKLKAAREEQERAAAAAKALAAAQRESEEQTKRTVSTLKSFGSTLLRVTGLSSALGAALSTFGLGNLFGGAIRSAKDMERALDDVQAVAGATTKEVRQFGAAAEAAAARSRFTAIEAVGALGELARATGSASTALAALPATMNLAQAGGIELAQAATFITTTLTQFGLAAEEAGRVADVLARAANSTTADVQSLGLALSYVAPIARQLGMGLEETTAIIGALADQGFRGERAGTALRNVMSALSDPTSEFSQALLGAGVVSENFADIITGLAAAGDAGKRAIMSLDAEGRPAILALVNSGGEGIRRLKADLDAASGSAAETARIMSENLDAAWSKFINSLDAARRKLVEPLLDPLRKQFEDAATKVRAFIETAQFERIQQAVKNFALAASESILKFVGSINFDTVATRVSTFATDAKVWFERIGESAETMASAVDIAGGTIATVFNVMKTLVFGAAAIITATLAGIGKVAVLTAKTLAELQGLGQGFTAGLKPVEDALDGMIAVARAFGDVAKQSATDSGKAIVKLSESIEGAGKKAEQAAPPVAKLGVAAEEATPKVEGLVKEMSFVPDYAAGMADGVSAALGPTRDLGREALLSANSITRLERGLKPIDPILEILQANLATASEEFARVIRSADRTPASMAAAEAGFNRAAEELRDYEAASRGAAIGTKVLETAAASLGLKSLVQLQKDAAEAAGALKLYQYEVTQGTRSQESLNQAFAVYAQRQLELAQASGASARARILDELRVQAALTGNLDKLDAMIAKYDGLAKMPPPAPPVAPLQQYNQELGNTNEQLKAAGVSAQDMANKTGDWATRSKGFLQNVAEAIKQTRSEFEAISDAAAREFDRTVLNMERVRTSVGAGAGFDTVARNLRIAADETRQAVEAQRAVLADMVLQLNAYGDGASSVFEMTGLSAEQAAQRFAVLDQQIQDGTTSFTLLGNEDLGPLQQALDAARGKAEALRNEALSAAEALKSTADSLRDAIDQQNGDQASVENRRFQRQIEEIRAQAELAGELGRQQAAEAEALAKQLHDANIKRIRDEAAEKKRNEQSSRDSDSSTTTQGGGSASKIDITVNGGSVGQFDTRTMSQNDLRALTEKIAPMFLQVLQRHAQNAGFQPR